jgi:hypothetical protein
MPLRKIRAETQRLRIGGHGLVQFSCTGQRYPEIV